MRLLHRCVLEAFVGPCPTGMEGSHKNDDVTDNRLDNLLWETRSDNCKRRRRPAPENSRNRKLSVAQVLEVRSLVAAGAVQRHLAKRFGVTPTCIHAIVKRKSWPDVHAATKNPPKSAPAAAALR